MIKLLIVADDFTGGLDTGVQFASQGIRTRVVTNPLADYQQAADGCEVLVVVAETRHLPAAEAYEAVYQVVEKSRSIGIEHIYKKTDSALRGNIGAELSAALKASGADTLAFLPAMPGIHRITVHGTHLIDGAPVADSVFGRDPFEPVTESDVSRLIALQSDAPTHNASPDDIPDVHGILIIDAQSDQDLERAGKALAERHQLRITAGCAGFAAVLPGLLGLTRSAPPQLPRLSEGIFVLCGSVNPITQKQLAYAEQNGFKRIHISPEQKLTPDYFQTEAGKQALKSWAAAKEAHPWMVLDANDESDANLETQAYASAHSLSTESIRSGISTALGHILPAMLRSASPRTLLITGGDTLLQCMNVMGVLEMEPLCEVFPGIVLSQFETDGQQRFVITKSGGFGQETLLCDLKALIQSQSKT